MTQAARFTVADTLLLWELRGTRSGTVLTCALTGAGAGAWHVAVTLGPIQLHGETFSQRAHAINRAKSLYTDFVKNGWTEAYQDH